MRNRQRTLGAGLAGIIAVLALAFAPASALAQDNARSLGKAGSLGVGAAAASLLYGPAKILYAGGGLVVGGLAYVFSGGDGEVATVVLTPAVRGDYVLTPDQLTGKKPIEFIGRRPGSEVEDLDVAAAPPAW